MWLKTCFSTRLGPAPYGLKSKHLPCLQSVDIQIEITYECIRPDTFFHTKNVWTYFFFRFVMCPSVRMCCALRSAVGIPETRCGHNSGSSAITLNVQYMAHKLMGFDAYTPLKMQINCEHWLKHTSLEIGRAPPTKISIRWQRLQKCFTIKWRRDVHRITIITRFFFMAILWQQCQADIWRVCIFFVY